MPSTDERAQAIGDANEAARKLLNNFRTVFYDNPSHPAALIVRSDAPSRIRNSDALAAFRNCFAMAVTLREWANLRSSQALSGPRFSNYFDFYPV
ncbi:MAG TPA: hypothetical protein VFJ03_06980, partial [Candidatus Limnocylindria bacterium]|nr:hypothetical protein [Candidatus Limnocylindria bacterium]